MRTRPPVPLDAPSQPYQDMDKAWDNYGIGGSQKSNLSKVNYDTPKKDLALPEIKSFQTLDVTLNQANRSASVQPIRDQKFQSISEVNIESIEGKEEG